MAGYDKFIENSDTSVSLEVGPVTKEESDRADKLFESITKEADDNNKE